jgi:hypothetical protein
LAKVAAEGEFRSDLYYLYGLLPVLQEES